MNCKREPRRYEEGLLQKRSPENPPPSPVLVKRQVTKMLHRPRMEMILKKKSGGEEDHSGDAKSLGGCGDKVSSILLKLRSQGEKGNSPKILHNKAAK